MGITPDQFIANNVGKSIFIPGYQSAECVAAFWAYNNQVGSGERYSANGAYNLWTQNGQAYTWFTYDRIAPGSQQSGDWGIWSGVSGPYTNGGAGHVAMYYQDSDFFSQNPGPFQLRELSLNGIVGYLRLKGVAPLSPVGAGGGLVNRKVTQSVAWVRTAPVPGAPLAPGYGNGLPLGTVLAVKGFVAGTAPDGMPNDNAWYVTKSGFYVWANAAENSLAGLARL